jgi:hypothetical protein
LFGELSQQRVVPHSWHVRRCIHFAPIFTHSSHSRRSAVRTVVMAAMCSQGPLAIAQLEVVGDA